MIDVRALLREVEREAGTDLAGLLEERPHPPALEPQLASPEDDTPLGDGWIHERKLDGVRLLSHVTGERVTLRTRTGADRSATFPELLDALRALGLDDAVLDGEVVALDGERTSFSRLQRRLGSFGGPGVAAKDVPVHLYLFDVLHLDGVDLRRLPLLLRKEVLRRLPLREPVRFTEHRDGPIEAHLDEACRQGWEGLIAKRVDAPYRSGRHASWRKFRCLREGRFVVVGWTDPQGARPGLGALLLAEALDGRLRFVGRVGSGLDDALLTTLGAHLRSAGEAPCPVEVPVGEEHAHWTVPHLVIEVRFAGWTDAGRLRHPSVLCLRPDLSLDAATGDSARTGR